MPDGDPTNESIGARLAHGVVVGDDEIDALMPGDVRALSSIHWTPVQVAQSAARFLVGTRGSSAHILDVGSGAGKFCAVGALTTGARFTGVEQRPHLVHAAKRLARALDAQSATFVAGRMEELDWSGYSGIYLFNPFGERFLEASEMIDKDNRVGWALYVHYVRAALARLYLMAPGTRVVTYHGLGAPMPPGYELVDAEQCESGTLRYYLRIDPALVETRKAPTDLFDDNLLDEATAEMRPNPRAHPTPPELCAFLGEEE